MAGENLGVVWGQGNFYQHFAFLFAKDNTDGFVFVVEFYEAVVVVYVHLHLAEVLVGQFADFEVNNHKAW